MANTKFFFKRRVNGTLSQVFSPKTEPKRSQRNINFGQKFPFFYFIIETIKILS